MREIGGGKQMLKRAYTRSKRQFYSEKMLKISITYFRYVAHPKSRNKQRSLGQKGFIKFSRWKKDNGLFCN